MEDFDLGEFLGAIAGILIIAAILIWFAYTAILSIRERRVNIELKEKIIENGIEYRELTNE